MVKRQFETIISAFKRVNLSNWLWLVLGTAAFVVLIGGVGSWGLRVVEDWTHLQQNPTDATQKQFNASLEIVKAIVGGIGTLATIVGGIVLYLNFRVANQNAKTAIKTVEVANRNAEIANKTADLAELRLITERFSKAVEQLGSDKIEVRLGGIYALERIAQDSVRDHWTIMEVLTAFVREKSPVKSKAKESFIEHYLQQRETEATPTPVAKDVQAALTVIGRRNVENDLEGKQLDLSYSNLVAVNLYQARLSSALLDAADLRGADLRFATLNKASLLDADLSDAFLIGTKLIAAELIGAKLNGADLNDADLRFAVLNETAFFGVDLTAVSLFNTPLNSALLCQTTMPDGTISDRDCVEMGLPPSNSSASKAELDSH